MAAVALSEFGFLLPVLTAAMEGQIELVILPRGADPTLTPVFGICFPISHLWAIRKSLALRMRGSGGFLLSTDWATEHARTAAVER